MFTRRKFIASSVALTSAFNLPEIASAGAEFDPTPQIVRIKKQYESGQLLILPTTHMFSPADRIIRWARGRCICSRMVDTYFRIHGTTAPDGIGQSLSNGCIRMLNEHVKDLYERVPIGTIVTVL